MIGFNVDVQNLIHGIVRQFLHGAVERINRSIADEHVNLAQAYPRLVYQILESLALADMRRNYNRFASLVTRCLRLGVDRVGNLLAHSCLTTADHYLGALTNHLLGNCATNALTGACDQCDFICHIEKIAGHRCLPLCCLEFSA